MKKSVGNIFQGSIYRNNQLLLLMMQHFVFKDEYSFGKFYLVERRFVFVLLIMQSY